MKRIQNIFCYSAIFIELVGFNAAFADWSDPVNIFKAPVIAPYANTPLVGVDNLGNAVIIFETSSDNSTYNIQAAQLTQGVPTNFPPLTTTGIAHGIKALAVNGIGNAAADWVVDNTGTSVFASLFLNNVWGEALVISGGASGPVITNDFPPGISLDNNNASNAIWSEYDMQEHIQTNRYTTAWNSLPLNLFSSDTLSSWVAYQGSPYGHGIASWVDQNPMPYILNAGYFNGQNWSTFVASNDVFSNCNSPIVNVSINLSNNGMILWQDTSGGLSSKTYINEVLGLQKNVYTLLSGEFIDDSMPLGISLDDSGNAFALFSTTLAGISYVKISHYTNGEWQTPFILDQTAIGRFSYLNIGVDHLGDAYAVWERDIDEIGAVFYNHYTAATDSWSAAENTPIALSHSSYSITQPNLSVNATDGATVVWTLFNNDSTQTVQAVYIIPPKVSTFSGAQIKNKFITQTNLINILSWTAPSSPLIANFYLFRDGIKIATIPATGPFTYEDRNRRPNVIYTYELTTVSEEGMQSLPVSINVP